jgi:hypothetical protein
LKNTARIVDFFGREFEIDLGRGHLMKKLFEQNLEKLRGKDILNAIKIWTFRGWEIHFIILMP